MINYIHRLITVLCCCHVYVSVDELLPMMYISVVSACDPTY